MSVKFRRWWLVISIPLVVGLVTAEILLQVYYRYTGTYYSSLPATIRANEPYPRVFYEAHPFLPYALKPTRRVWINNDRNSPPRQNRAAWIDHRVNAYGARGPEISAKKAPGTVRVAVIGGSTTFSVHTREADSWPRVLQDLLNEKAGGAGAYEVINFGTPKATSVYSLVALGTRIIHLDPDIVIVYHGVNDVSTWTFPGLRPDHSHVFADMKAVPGWIERVPANAFRSALATYLVQQFGLRLEQNFGERENLRRGPMRAEEGVTILLDNYRSMRGIAEAHGARFMTATFHMLTEADEYGRAIAAFNNALRDWGRKEGVVVADLAARIPHDDRSVHTDGAHFTAKGDRMVAEILAETIRQAEQASAPPPGPTPE